ncbi:MAG: hypothetical protein Q4A07_09775 [Coriobacteriales bacterium]|nr:hypothetical protein [Coriobacteriales bacterium]
MTAETNEVETNGTTVELNDAYEYESDTPRPVDADSVARGAFARLEEGQGAVSASRRPSGGAHLSDEKPEEMDKRTLALIISGMAVALVLVLAVVVGMLATPAQDASEVEALGQVAVAADQSVDVHGNTYLFEEKDGKYQLLEVPPAESSQPVSLGELEGTPAGLVLYDGSIIVPQNLEGKKWNVVAYTIGSGWSPLMDKAGNVTGGKGKIGQVSLEGSTLVLTVDSERVEVPLVW